MPIILFDGFCNFCNRTVNTIIAHDKDAQFQFATNESNAAKELIHRLGLSSEIFNSVVLIEDDQVYTKTDAVIKIASNLSGWPKAGRLLKFIPKPLRDFFYDSFAKYRYQLFGKRSTCMMPNDAFKKRFLS